MRRSKIYVQDLDKRLGQDQKYRPWYQKVDIKRKITEDILFAFDSF